MPLSHDVGIHSEGSHCLVTCGYARLPLLVSFTCIADVGWLIHKFMDLIFLVLLALCLIFVAV
jgi:hypothetical protein